MNEEKGNSHCNSLLSLSFKLILNKLGLSAPHPNAFDRNVQSNPNQRRTRIMD